MDSHNIISNLSKDIFILEDESNPLTSNVSRIYPKTTIDQVYDVSNDEDIKNLRQIIAELREDIQSTGSGVIPFPVRSVNGLTGDVVITKSLLGLDKVDNTSDNEKPLSTLQLRNVITILDNYGITEPGNFNTLFNNAINVHNVSHTAHADIRSNITNEISTHNLSNESHSDIRSSISSTVSDHNSSTTAHNDIRTNITNHNSSTTAHSDIRGSITSEISTHNSSDTAHNDIRVSISDHNTSTTAHSDIRGDITSAVSTHDSSDAAHTDIRGNITNLQTNITSLLLPYRTPSTTYAIGDVVMVGGTMKRLECVVAGTTDSGALGTTTVGQLVVDGTVTWIVDNFFDPPVGTVRYALAIPAGWIKLNGGRLINGKLDYSRLWAWAVANDLVSYIDPIGDVSAIISNNSSKFWAFLRNVSPNQFYLPNFVNFFMEGGNSPGSRIAAGLPNIKGEFQISAVNQTFLTSQGASGAFSSEGSVGITGFNMGGSQGNQHSITRFNAHSSSNIYSDSVTTVQPRAIEMYPIIKY